MKEKSWKSPKFGRSEPTSGVRNKHETHFFGEPWFREKNKHIHTPIGAQCPPKSPQRKIFPQFFQINFDWHSRILYLLAGSKHLAQVRNQNLLSLGPSSRSAPESATQDPPPPPTISSVTVHSAKPTPSNSTGNEIIYFESQKQEIIRANYVQSCKSPYVSAVFHSLKVVWGQMRAEGTLVLSKPALSGLTLSDVNGDQGLTLTKFRPCSTLCPVSWLTSQLKSSPALSPWNHGNHGSSV